MVASTRFLSRITTDNRRAARCGVCIFNCPRWRKISWSAAPAVMIWDVAVDIREGSLTFGRWVGVESSAENFRQLYVPSLLTASAC